MKSTQILIYTFLLFFTLGCNFSAKDKKLYKTESGFEYEIIKSGNNTSLHMADVVKLHIMQYADDSLMNTTYNSMPEFVKIDSTTIMNYDYTAILPLLHVEDSAVCYFPTTQIIKNAKRDVEEVPFYLQKAKHIKVCIKVLNSYKSDSIARLDFNKENGIYMAKVEKKDSINLLKTRMQFDSLINKLSGPIIKLQNGICMYVIKAGTGKSLVLGDSINIHYKSYLANGKFLESTDPQKPLVLKKSGNYEIKGFYQAITNLTKGSIAKLFIPATEAYGKRGDGEKVPPFSNLIIEVEIL